MASWYVTPQGIVQANTKPNGSSGPFSTLSDAGKYVQAHTLSKKVLGFPIIPLPGAILSPADVQFAADNQLVFEGEDATAAEQQVAKERNALATQSTVTAAGLLGAGAAAAAAGSQLGGFTTFFHNLTQPVTWIRVIEIIAGGILLTYGLAHITGADNAVFSAVKKLPPVLPV